MNKVLWKRAMGVFSVLLCCACVARLWAQEASEPMAKTPDEAAKIFIATLSALDQPAMSMMGSVVSLRQLEKLDNRQRDLLTTRFFRYAFLARYQTRSVPNSEGDRATVEVEPASEMMFPAVSCLKEDNSWRVDLLATARTWFGPDDPVIKDIELTLQGDWSKDPLASRRCQSNLRQMALAFMQYTQDYDEVFPPANKWTDVLKPYQKDDKFFHCPIVGQNSHGYAMNWKFSRQPIAAIESPANTVLLYETNILARNQNGDGRDLVFRHMQNDQPGAQYAFADGHIAFLAQKQPQNFRLFITPARSAKPKPRHPS